jgi:D-aminoacyl-tRNA deacylase
MNPILPARINSRATGAIIAAVRAVLQRVTSASVSVGDERVSAIGPGLLVLVGVGRGDGSADVDVLADKIAHLRVFSDGNGQMNRALPEVGGELLVVSQFTLFGDCRKGRRPSYSDAAAPEEARPLYEELLTRLRASGLTVREGVFRAAMKVELVNDGPVTLLLDTRKNF